MAARSDQPNPLWLSLLPELRRFPRQDRTEALAAARATSLDTLELIGMALALVAVTALTKYALPDGSVFSRFVMALLNFAVALPLLVATLGPFHLRRLRRGLRAQLEAQGRQ
jgi:uncharacterized membrane protein